MKRHLYILSTWLILLTGLVYLNVSVARGNSITQDYNYLQFQPCRSDKCGAEEAAVEDLLDLMFDTGETPLPEELPGLIDKPFPALLLNTFILNPLLFDLPPPATHL